MYSLDAELHVVWTVPSQQLIEDSREIMLMASGDAVSVWPDLSVSLVISVMVGMLIAGILMIEMFAFLFYDYLALICGLCSKKLITCDICVSECFPRGLPA